MLADVHDGCVVELHEGVREDLPVGPALDPEGVPVGHLVERIVLDARAASGPRNSRSDWLGSAAKFTKMNPANTSQCTGTSP